MIRLRLLVSSLVVAAAAACAGCNDAALKTLPDGGTPVNGLTGEQAGRVVAKIGERAITVGEFARALDRMDPYDRLRYQSRDRRRELLTEMVDIELLAAEARRRGLDKEPETQEAIDQILRDAILLEGRKGVGAPTDLPPADVRAYFEAHPDKFTEPEHRRVAAIVLDDKKKAEDVLKDAVGLKSAIEWGELFGKTSTTAPKKADASPVELAGDLGIVGPPSDPHGGSPRVPEAVRAAVFTLSAPGDVLDHLVEAEGKFFIVRLAGSTPAHIRTLQEADRSIRIILLQERIAAKDKALENELRKKIPVQIDESALATVSVQVPPREDPHPHGAGEEHAKPPPAPSPR